MPQFDQTLANKIKKVLSIPSKLIYSVDVPEVENFRASFFYNYYLPDESVNDYRNDSKDIKAVTDKMNLDQNFFKKAGSEIEGYISSTDLKKLPRYVKLNWNPNNRLNITTSEQTLILNNDYKLTPQDLPKVLKENQFASSYYTSIESSNGVLVKSISSLFDKVPAPSNTNLRKTLAKSYQENFNIFNESNLDFQTSMSAIAYQKNGIELKNQVKDSYLEKLRGTKFQSQINNNFLYDILKNASGSQHPNNSNLAPFLEYSRKVNKFNLSFKLSNDEYKTSIPFHTTYQYQGYQNKVGSNLDNESTFSIVGYVLDKVEVFSDGTINRFEPIVINGGKSNSYIDYKIRYGAIYFYSIRSVMDVTYNAIDNLTSDFVRVGSYIASNDRTVDVQTIEHVSPPPPSDIRIFWDYDRFNQNTIIFDHENNRPYPNTGTRGSLMLCWCMPVNLQMDIKKIQIFRRKSINDPFEIIKVFDFDDSFSKFLSLDSNINQSVITRSSSPVLYYYDDDFYQNSEYIYSLATEDAHGLSSNYSEQFKIIFDKFNNKIQKTLISIAGAPKAYPNMYLEKDLFVDTMKVSNKKTMNVYLNPDCIKSNKENFFIMNDSSDKKTGYVMNIINADVQKSKQIKINIIKRMTNS